jgi:hypothetical protein
VKVIDSLSSALRIHENVSDIFPLGVRDHLQDSAVATEDRSEVGGAVICGHVLDKQLHVIHSCQVCEGAGGSGRLGRRGGRTRPLDVNRASVSIS